MSRGHPKAFLAIFVWHNFWEGLPAGRCHPIPIAGHSAGFLASILSIPNPFYPIVHSMCIPSYIPARTLELNSWTRRNCGNVRETQGRAVFCCEGKEALDELGDEKTWRKPAVFEFENSQLSVGDVSFVSVEVFRSQQRVQISEGRSSRSSLW